MNMCPVVKLHFLVCLFHGDVSCSKVTLLSVSVSLRCALSKVTLLSVSVSLRCALSKVTLLSMSVSWICALF